MRLIGIGLTALTLGGLVAFLVASQAIHAQTSPARPTPTPVGLASPGTHAQLAPTSTTAVIVPSRVTDLAPGLPEREKAAVIVQHPDGTYEKFLVDPAQVNSFIKTIRPSTLVTIAPPGSLMGHVPTQAAPASGAAQSLVGGTAQGSPALAHGLGHYYE